MPVRDHFGIYEFFRSADSLNLGSPLESHDRRCRATTFAKLSHQSRQRSISPGDWRPVEPHQRGCRIASPVLGPCTRVQSALVRDDGDVRTRLDDTLYPIKCVTVLRRRGEEDSGHPHPRRC